MKNIYRVERMTAKNYERYMNGDYYYHVEELNIEAETAEEAVKMAQAEGYVVNETYVKTLEELEAIEQARKEALRAKEEKAERAKAKREAREAEKAAEAGLTVEEYKKVKRRQAEIRKVEREIEQLEAELANKKARLEYLKK